LKKPTVGRFSGYEKPIGFGLGFGFPLGSTLYVRMQFYPVFIISVPARQARLQTLARKHIATRQLHLCHVLWATQTVADP
jgi:hypothetical protein